MLALLAWEAQWLLYRDELLTRTGGDVVQVGWESGPTLALLAWEAQWLLYTGELERNLTRPAVSLPIFTDQVFAAHLHAPGLIPDSSWDLSSHDACVPWKR